ncbi:hypothetical protein CBM2592_A90135 [Cupriavidus taiwanensis]|nr:hypothetical protein CBM2592_A90135 [Cupriavidus taiwanensis]SOY90765.1 hypothetical protein CBM2591_A90134 [Cupriavidus taiwanensis]SOZ63548.1 hypothetical protein CBM2617_A70112 [Cupriavidus taiwanensis]SOZ82581.1 hypothetical protein CBM2618_A80113 [Cupriavidus taiwanensis]SOZ84433.1 hypothetical protein CBM2622_A80112 [Cupriavidus taiwanensis]
MRGVQVNQVLIHEAALFVCQRHAYPFSRWLSPAPARRILARDLGDFLRPAIDAAYRHRYFPQPSSALACRPSALWASALSCNSSDEPGSGCASPVFRFSTMPGVSSSAAWAMRSASVRVMSAGLVRCAEFVHQHDGDHSEDLCFRFPFEAIRMFAEQWLIRQDKQKLKPRKPAALSQPLDRLPVVC